MKLILSFIITLSLYADSSITLAQTLITHHEGFRSKPYKDTYGLSIGYGTSLTHGISKEEALILLNYRTIALNRKLMTRAWFRNLPTMKQAIVLDLAYNVGITGVLKFKDMITALSRHDYHLAALAMKDSIWYRQTGTRAKHLVQLMEK